jgi:hypothetical protein
MAIEALRARVMGLRVRAALPVASPASSSSASSSSASASSASASSASSSSASASSASASAPESGSAEAVLDDIGVDCSASVCDLRPGADASPALRNLSVRLTSKHHRLVEHATKLYAAFTIEYVFSLCCHRSPAIVIVSTRCETERTKK